MIFYFSGTGLTRNFAQAISTHLNEKAVDIVSALNDKQFNYTLNPGERLGFASPVYFGRIPEIVIKFIQKLNITTADHYYAYIALTCHAIAGDSIQLLSRALLKRGLTVNAAFVLKTVDTFLPFYPLPAPERLQQLEQQTIQQTEFIAQQIDERTTGIQHKEQFKKVSTLFMHPLYSIMRHTKFFHVSDKCTSCGACARHCPVGAIVLSDASPKHPEWIKSQCLLCLRCLQHCPQNAIDYANLTQGKQRYQCPEPK